MQLKFDSRQRPALSIVAIAASLAARSVNAAAAQSGWRVLSGVTGSFCVHNALLPNNTLMCIERPHTHPYPWINNYTNGETSTIITVDPDAGAISYVVNPLKYNAFCAGHSQAADGGIHVIGGDRQSSSYSYDHSNATNYLDYSVVDSETFLFTGIDRIRSYHLPETDADILTGSGWDESLQMSTDRWYPTVVTLGDGTLFIVGGDNKNIDFGNLSQTINPTYEFYPSKYAPAITSSLLTWAFPHNLYPISFLLPSGKIFLMVSNRTVIIDPNVDPGTTEANTVVIATVPVLDHAPWIYPHTPTSFILPLKESEGYSLTIMICGGTKNSTFQASSDCIAIDNPEYPNANYRIVPNMPSARLMPDSAILPDGTILLTNGIGWGQAGGNAGQCQYGAAPVFTTDLYHPDNNTWSSLELSTVARMYHSGAILLKDGSVITTGNEMANYLDFWGTPTAEGPLDAFADSTKGFNSACYPVVEVPCTSPWEQRIEQYTPAYLTSGNPRPIVKAFASGTVLTYNSTVAVQLDSTGASVKQISLIRYTTTTHSTNTDQRLIIPILLYVNTTVAIFRIPPNSSVAPPGNWHVFGVSGDGVPSIAQTVLFGSGPVTNVAVPTGGSSTTSSSSESLSRKIGMALFAVLSVAFLVL
ncbi:hypothetical protein HK100_001196 [Physocladia obscura]|uniref:Glyoxal oxidase n=1 Tax=Physocladia obscura TaxID=109957 RepID=A0AAD5SX44_9FUNG|nr:hypothetical protein HK100_001196 [Physocladia obscura]